MDSFLDTAAETELSQDSENNGFSDFMLPLQHQAVDSTMFDAPNLRTTGSSSSSRSHHGGRSRERRQHGSGRRQRSQPQAATAVHEDVLCRHCGQFHEKNGPHLYDYLDQVDEDLSCLICLQPLVNPVDTRCGHTFCYPCLKSHLKIQRFCPVDRNTLGTKDVSSSTVLVNKLLDKLVIICPNKEYCQDTLPRCDLEAHLANRCPGAPVICARANLGCNFGGPRLHLPQHMEECLFYQNLSSKEISDVILEGSVSLIEISTGGSYEFGMTLIGGADTPLIYIIVQDIFPSGAVAKDGRLHINDQILDVNGTDLTVLRHKECISLILKAAEMHPKMRIAVYREKTEDCGKMKTREETHKISLDKSNGPKFLGLKLMTKRLNGATGLYVEDLVPDGIATQDGRLQPEDRILEINGEDVRNATQEKAVQVIQASENVEFVVSREPRCATPEPPPPILRSSSVTGDTLVPSESLNTLPASGVPPSENVTMSFGRSPSFPCAQFTTFGHGSNGVSTFLSPNANQPSDILTDLPYRTISEVVVHISKGEGESLGFSVAGGRASPLTTSPRQGGKRPQGDRGPDRRDLAHTKRHQDVPIYVTKIAAGGSVDKHGVVKRGDVITFVNGVSLLGLSHAEAVKVLKTSVSSTSVTLHIIDGLEDPSTPEYRNASSFIPTWDYWLHLPVSVQPVKTITITRSQLGSLGFSIVGGSDSGCLLSQAIFVKSIVAGSPASRDGRLRCGDVIVAVDDHQLSRVPHSHAVNLLKQGQIQNVVLTVVSWPGSIV